MLGLECECIWLVLKTFLEDYSREKLLLLCTNIQADSLRLFACLMTIAWAEPAVFFEGIYTRNYATVFH